MAPAVDPIVESSLSSSGDTDGPGLATLGPSDCEVPGGLVIVGEVELADLAYPGAGCPGQSKDRVVSGAGGIMSPGSTHTTQGVDLQLLDLTSGQVAVVLRCPGAFDELQQHPTPWFDHFGLSAANQDGSDGAEDLRGVSWRICGSEGGAQVLELGRLYRMEGEGPYGLLIDFFSGSQRERTSERREHGGLAGAGRERAEVGGDGVAGDVVREGIGDHRAAPFGEDEVIFRSPIISEGWLLVK